MLTSTTTDFHRRHSPDGRYLSASRGVESILGYGTDELVGTNPYELFHPDDIERIAADHAGQLDGAPSRVT